MSSVKVLVAGWFSFEDMGATGGDLMVRDVVCEWLRAIGVPFDVATTPPFEGGVDWQEVNPESYSHVCFVCGPIGNVWPVTDFMSVSKTARRSEVESHDDQDLDEWNPFSLLARARQRPG